MASIPPQISGLRDWRALARGGFATVWAARQESLNRMVAVKVDQRTLDSESEQRRFLREAAAAGRMSGHPGIVTVHDAGILGDNRPYLVMELCEGGSLSKWVKADKRPSAEQVREVGVRIADALSAAHARSVLHRDVKPANILIDAYGHAGLADFGLAALPDPGSEQSDHLEGITPAYAPPEVFQREPPTEVGDVYSLGATLYALLAGRPPRWVESGSPTISEMLQRHEEPIERIPGVNDGLMDVLLKAMSTDPADRPTAAGFRDLLNEVNLDPPHPHARRAAPAGTATASAGPDTLTTEPDRSTPTKALAGVTALSERPAPAGAVPDLEQLPERGDQKTDQRRWRQRRGILVAGAVVLGSAVALGLISQLPRQVVGGPPVASPASTSAAGSPSGKPTTASSPTRTPSPTPPPAVTMPDGAKDCSRQLGKGTYCTPEPECWGSVNSLWDSPRRALRAKCNEDHVYQTFAAGELKVIPLRQTALDRLPQVKKVCRPEVVNEMLAEDDQRPDWEVYAIPPQETGEMFYRCIFGYGERVGAYTLKPPPD